MTAAALARVEQLNALEGKVAVITGSTSGIGLCIARALAAEGATIVLNGLGDQDQIEMLVQTLGARFDVPVGYGAADMSDRAAIANMIERTRRGFGPVDILVNNVGIRYVAPIE
jgi:3-hydroxybutyrate dehydrogenase